MQSNPGIELRTDRWVAANKAVGRNTLKERAEGAGVSYTHLSRIENRLADPSNPVMAKIMVAFPRRRLDFFFRVRQ